MAKTPEGKVKDWLKKRIGETFPDVYEYHPPGGMFGRGGTADGFYLWHGVFFAIEAKAVENKKGATALQLKALRHVTRQGGVGAVITGKDEVRFQAIVARIKELEDGRFKSPV